MKLQAQVYKSVAPPRRKVYCGCDHEPRGTSATFIESGSCARCSAARDTRGFPRLAGSYLNSGSHTNVTSVDLNDPIAVLLGVIRALERAGIEAAAYGGLALAMYGEPRETKDADLAGTTITGPP